MSTTTKSRKKMARRKSISDILAQSDRILSRGVSQNRQYRVVTAADRYTDNIMGTRKFQKDNRFKAYDRKYSRSTYMGLNAG